MKSAAAQLSKSELADRRIGEILIATTGLAPERVEEVLAAQRAGESLRIGELLVRAQRVTEVDVLRAVALQVERRSRSAPGPSEPLSAKPAGPAVEPASSQPTRLVALVVTSIGFGLSAIYHAVTDSFVAPLILSPDSETVVQSKLSLSRLLSERDRLLARIQQESSEIEAADRTIGVLKSGTNPIVSTSRASSRRSPRWSKSRTPAGKRIGSQRALLRRSAEPLSKPQDRPSAECVTSQRGP